ncbi:VWA domain-containing protein [Paludibaculum fermentans]|uniref:VWA domain-containing protein n=1 Tax=Paludibaculum fermentans TaxID=1473598 RepID=UPI003EBF9220
MRPVILFTFFWSLAAFAQQVGGNASAGKPETATFTAGAQLVVETVTVTDKQGKPVEGLTAKDFTVTEDGVPQQIRVFEYQRLSTAATGAPPAGPEQVKVYEKLGQTRIATETPGDGRYKNRRLMVLYFDMTAMQQAEQIRALAAAQKFIRSQMTPDDLFAILRYSGAAVEVLQDFTDDRNRLLSILQTLIIGEGQGLDESTNDAATGDTGAAFGQDDSEFNIFNTDRQLSALQTAAKMLGQLSAKKSLIYFSSGLRLNGMNNQAQLMATVNSAIRSGVSFWPIDARGLVADAPMGDASQASPGNAGMYTGAGMQANTARFQQSQDTLYALAADTGGKALFDTNDLTKGIVQAAEAISSYYVIGYYASNAAQDGKFRRIKITLNNEMAANLDYRQGYFAGKQFTKFSVADKERQLEDALMLPDPITELTIAMEIDYFQLNRAEYYVPVVVKIPGRELALAKRHGADRTVIDFIGEIKNSFGTTVMNLRDKVTAKLSEATAAELAKRPIVYDTGYTLLPGEYTIKFLARDAETGRIGTYQSKFVIPNLNKDEDRLPISSVVLSSQRVDMKDAIYNALKEKDRHDDVNPLVQDGQKLIPSVTRVFSRDRSLLVFLHSYQQGPAEAQPLIAVVSFYRDQAKAFESTPVEVTASGGGRLKTLPIQFEIPLAGLAPGKYDCQLTVLNPDGQKAAFWQAPILVVQ